ncbi:MAG: hypothetical protein LH609_15105 [Rudanella sp.]|nr:hypothetical protein [Rudanella sp.]
MRLTETNDPDLEKKTKTYGEVGGAMVNIAKFFTGLAKLFAALTLIAGAVYGGAVMINSFDKPEPEPVSPVETVSAVPVDLTGRWSDMYGNYLTVSQTDKRISYQLYDVNSTVIGQGTGTVYGRQLRLSGYGKTFLNLLLGGQTHYAGQFMLDESGSQLSGTIPVFSSDNIILTKVYADVIGKNPMPRMATIERTNWQLKSLGANYYWATFDFVSTGGDGKVDRQKEARLLEKMGGEWKMVSVITLPSPN